MNLDITDFSVLKISQDKEGIRIPLSTQGKLKFQNMFKQESDVRINILVKKNKHFIVGDYYTDEDKNFLDVVIKPIEFKNQDLELINTIVKRVNKNRKSFIM